MVKLLQLPNIGMGGGLGNQLFTIASTIGLALRYGYTPRFPGNWKYRDEFPNIPDEWFGETMPTKCVIKEPCFEYSDLFVTNIELASTITDLYGKYESVTISGYLQSPKYWEGYGFQIREYLMPRDAQPGWFHGTAVHFRRGDYVGNPNYVELPMSYYLNALENMPNPIFFSDDARFTELHFGKSAQGSEMDDFRSMIACKSHIVSNSTFAWWAAYLSGGKVIRPDAYFAGPLAKNSTKDFWPEKWVNLRIGDKYDLTDVTFVIPVMYDHIDRMQNLKVVVDFLQHNFDTNILIGEVNTRNFEGAPGYVHFDLPTFHRTKVLNELTRRAKTTYVFNWDADVVCSPYQIYMAVKRLREGVDIVYPYDGRFFWADRSIINYWPAHKNINCFIGHKFKSVGATGNDSNSYGGAVGYEKEAFFRAGGENELHVSYSNEDYERWTRFNALLNVERVAGGLFHINHWRGQNSSFGHSNGSHNVKAWEIQAHFTKEQLQNLVNHPKWNNGMTLQELYMVGL